MPQSKILLIRNRAFRHKAIEQLRWGPNSINVLTEVRTGSYPALAGGIGILGRIVRCSDTGSEDDNTYWASRYEVAGVGLELSGVSILMATFRTPQLHRGLPC